MSSRHGCEKFAEKRRKKGGRTIVGTSWVAGVPGKERALFVWGVMGRVDEQFPVRKEIGKREKTVIDEKKK